MLVLATKIEQLPKLQVQLHAHPFQHLERGCVDTPLNEAQEIDADFDQLRKLLLSQLAFEPNRLQPSSELSPQGRGHLGVENALQDSRNLITVE
jgi:hypothetical protein